jgi:hypothetical protein
MHTIAFSSFSSFLDYSSSLESHIIMKAARLTSFDSPLTIETIEAPKLIPGSVIIRVLSVYIPSYTQNVFNGKLGKLTSISSIT